jgi:hypothetical protein
LNEIVSDDNNTKHHSLNYTPNNRNEQNPNRVTIKVTGVQVKRRRTNHLNTAASERKRKHEYTTADGNNNKRIKVQFQTII